MKSTDNFKKVINNHLESLAANDSIFAETLKKENKNIDDCITYILNQVKESGCNGFEDAEIFGMAVHYYDEDDLKAGKAINCKIVSNHTFELTEEEIKQAKDEARNKVIEGEKERIKKKVAPKKVEKESIQVSLF